MRWRTSWAVGWIKTGWLLVIRSRIADNECVLVVIKVAPEASHVIGFVRDVTGLATGVELDINIINPGHIPSRPGATKRANLVGNDIPSFDDIVSVGIQTC